MRKPYLVKVITTIEQEVVICEHSKAAAVRSAQQLAEDKAFGVFAEKRNCKCRVLREATDADIAGTRPSQKNR